MLTAAPSRVATAARWTSPIASFAPATSSEPPSALTAAANTLAHVAPKDILGAPRRPPAPPPPAPCPPPPAPRPPPPPRGGRTGPPGGAPINLFAATVSAD